MSLVDIANEAINGAYAWSAESYGIEEEAKYNETLMKSEYKKWHINDVRASYINRNMDGVSDITEEGLIKMINIMVENKIWKAKIKGTRYIMDISEGITNLVVMK
jgi:hypothetical protein